jgi:hypothetical protein
MGRVAPGEGMNPVPIRQNAPRTSPSYAWDPSLGATLEYANGKRYFVGIRDGKIARLAPPETPAEIPASHTARPGARKRRGLGKREIRARLTNFRGGILTAPAWLAARP